MSEAEENPAVLPAELFAEGVRLFNAGAYFACHEVLERAWLRESSAVRDVYRGILQIAVGLYHLERGNPRGAQTCLTNGVDRLQPFLPEAQGVDIERLLRDARMVRGALRSGGVGAGTTRLVVHGRIAVPVRG